MKVEPSLSIEFNKWIEETSLKYTGKIPSEDEKQNARYWILLAFQEIERKSGIHNSWMYGSNFWELYLDWFGNAELVALDRENKRSKII